MLILKKFARDIPAVIGLVIVMAAILVAIVGPWIAPYPGDIVASHLLQRLKATQRCFSVRDRQSRP
jgi:ABC-type antimicrobial peptide transport system permease subunit